MTPEGQEDWNEERDAYEADSLFLRFWNEFQLAESKERTHDSSGSDEESGVT